MAGIYIHIPFCKKKCIYCNFYSSTDTSLSKEFKTALVEEFRISNFESLESKIQKSKLETIYIGGGTPSLLPIEDLSEIFGALKKYFDIAPDAEITLEGNPESLTKEYLEDLRKHTPINRLSIGIQSFSDKDLKYLNRCHDSKTAIECVQNAQNSGFNNLSIDLIYGIPQTSNEIWKKNLDTFFNLDIPHLSAYCLTVEPNTILDHQIRLKKSADINEYCAIEQFQILLDKTDKHGFLNYEISNFAKPGYFSKHNSNYWNGTPYLGFGPSAHSYFNGRRRWNTPDVKSYILHLQKAELDFEEEILTQKDRYNEYVMTAIRTMWGIDEDVLRHNFPNEFQTVFLPKIEDFIAEKKVIKKGNSYVLTNYGKLFADAVAAELFI